MNIVLSLKGKNNLNADKIFLRIKVKSFFHIRAIRIIRVIRDMFVPPPRALFAAEQIALQSLLIKIFTRFIQFPMSAPLLSTKLYFPPASRRLVARPLLLKELSRSTQRPLTLVSAPAGYGKTTLVSSWLRDAGQAATWLSLDEDDNDPVRFLAYLAAALQKLDPHIGAGVLEALQAMQPPSPEILLGALINEIAGKLPPFFLVLDDFHFVHAQAVLQIVTFLLDHLPAQMHLVLISRTDPFLPLSRLRGRDQLVEIRAGLLRFTSEEAAAFLNDAMKLELSAEQVAAMEERTEGWIAGLQLAAVSLRAHFAAGAGLAEQRQEEASRFIAAFTGSHRHIFDYLIEEVLNRQPDEIRAFLLQTSILSRMSGPLCDAICTGSLDGQAMLEALEQANLFVIPLDDERRWYRYHHLFADVLNSRLKQLFPGRLPDLHKRAAEWHWNNGFAAEAISHALAAGDLAAATRFVEQSALTMLVHGELTTLLNWLASIQTRASTDAQTSSDAQAPGRPWLLVYHAWALALTGQPDGAEQLLQAAEGVLSSISLGTEARDCTGQITAIRAYAAVLKGDAAQATVFARQALAYLPERNLVVRGAITGTLGRACWLTGDLAGASAAFCEAERTGLASGNLHLASGAACSQADLFLEQGKLHQAGETYRRALMLARRPDGRYLPVAGRAYAGLSRVYYEWNDLATARQYAQPCIELCQQWGSAEPLAVGYVTLARLCRAQGEPGRAAEAMREAARLGREHHLVRVWAHWIEAFQVRFWLVQGELEACNRWVQENEPAVSADIPYVDEMKCLAYLRVLLAQGKLDLTLAWFRRLLQKFESTGETGRVVETLVLQALALQAKGELSQAMLAVEQALTLAGPEGHLRVFLDEGEKMHALLAEYRSLVEKRKSASAGRLARSVQRLLQAFAAESAPREKPDTTALPPGSPELLTGREIEVLREVAAGLSNQEIAAKLVIEVSTVKRHISNIYNKFGVQNRTQAVAKGRSLLILH